MGIIKGKIVLTGGPCAGKTTALTKIEEDLTEKGYRVFIVGESATELIKGGIRPFGKSAIDLLKFQELILQYQLNKEKIYEEAVASLSDEKECVIIYDRGAMDNKAYVNSTEFAQILSNQGLKELSLIDNYDMVIHLVTAADGKEEYYTLDNNNARTESPEQARALDKKTINAWVGHNNLKIIDNSTEFKEKIERAIDSIHNLLGNPISIRKQRKFAVDLNQSNFGIIFDSNFTKIEIEQTYLYEPFSNNILERRLRKRTHLGQDTYYLTIQKKGENGLSEIFTDKKITEKEYQKFLDLYEIKSMVNKTRYSFAKDHQYFKLDVFDDNKNIALLEIEPTIENQVIAIPSGLYVIDEVTNDANYQNLAMGIKEPVKTLEKRM